MPSEARENIHALLNNHASITRTVTLTDDGYVSTTESSDTAIVRVLHEHVGQMEARLESGLMVRRWDPAFVEYVHHIKDMERSFAATDNGLSMTVRGKTPEAIAVAQNHAGIITDFVTNGWEGHNRNHPAVLESSGVGQSGSCCRGDGCGGKSQRRGGKHSGGLMHQGSQE
ncbi:MAG: hypothetical protein IH628_09190 [Proteobacteria bacterium]|nr:hypothetical protein [Pseudomonadota bacterium]